MENVGCTMEKRQEAVAWNSSSEGSSHDNVLLQGGEGLGDYGPAW